MTAISMVKFQIGDRVSLVKYQHSWNKDDPFIQVTHMVVTGFDGPIPLITGDSEFSESGIPLAQTKLAPLPAYEFGVPHIEDIDTCNGDGFDFFFSGFCCRGDEPRLIEHGLTLVQGEIARMMDRLAISLRTVIGLSYENYDGANEASEEEDHDEPGEN
jgi:hypothetical protein